MNFSDFSKVYLNSRGELCFTRWKLGNFSPGAHPRQHAGGWKVLSGSPPHRLYKGLSIVEPPGEPGVGTTLRGHWMLAHSLRVREAAQALETHY